MIDIDLNNCCYKCDFPNIDTDIDESIDFEGRLIVDVFIQCKNKPICKIIEKVNENSNRKIKGAG